MFRVDVSRESPGPQPVIPPQAEIFGWKAQPRVLSTITVVVLYVFVGFIGGIIAPLPLVGMKEPPGAVLLPSPAGRGRGGERGRGGPRLIDEDRGCKSGRHAGAATGG